MPISLPSARLRLLALRSRFARARLALRVWLRASERLRSRPKGAWLSEAELLQRDVDELRPKSAWLSEAELLQRDVDELRRVDPDWDAPLFSLGACHAIERRDYDAARTIYGHGLARAARAFVESHPNWHDLSTEAVHRRVQALLLALAERDALAEATRDQDRGVRSSPTRL